MKPENLTDRSHLRREFEAIIHRDNSAKNRVISWLGLGFFVLLMVLDYFRYQEGFMQQNDLYIKIHFAHWILGLCILPAILFERNHRSKKKNPKIEQPHWLNYYCLITIGASLISMAVLGIEERGSIISFAVFALLINVGLILPFWQRTISNALSLIIMFIGINLMEKNIIASTAFYLETIGILVPAYLISSYQYTLHFNSFVNKKRLEEQNRSMQLANVELMMNALQAQMNPHFIFNTLNSIQHFLMENDRDSSMRYLARFARLIRLIFQYSKQKWISLEEEIAFLKLYIDLEELRFEQKITIHFEVDESLNGSMEYLLLPSLLIQPLIENAFKHGLMHLEREGKLNILFKKTEAFLYCQIEDNGVGREQAQLYDQWGQDEQRLTGLMITQQRLEMYSQNFSLEEKLKSELKLTDLVDKDNKPNGTRVELFLSLKMLQQISRRKTIPS